MRHGRFGPARLVIRQPRRWMAWNKDVFKNVPVVPIDLRQDDWIVSYNLLRQRKSADPAVLVDNLTDAMAYVWGAGGTNQTPLFARWAGNVLRALYEGKHTLVEAEFLVDRLPSCLGENQIVHSSGTSQIRYLSANPFVRVTLERCCAGD
jgi:hypothetical protein